MELSSIVVYTSYTRQAICTGKWEDSRYLKIQEKLLRRIKIVDDIVDGIVDDIVDEKTVTTSPKQGATAASRPVFAPCGREWAPALCARCRGAAALTRSKERWWRVHLRHCYFVAPAPAFLRNCLHTDRAASTSQFDALHKGVPVC